MRAAAAQDSRSTSRNARQVDELIQARLKLQARVLNFLTKPALRIRQLFLVEQDLAETKD
jgi:hypothetical protein